MMTMEVKMRSLPTYDELPEAPRGGRSAWGLFGPNDSVGMMNLLTPDVVVQAASLVKTGQVFPLDLPLDFIDPPLFERARLTTEHSIVPDRRGLNETLSDFNPQASSQWDGLAHVGYDTDQFYNGATLDEVMVDGRNTIGHWAARGIVGRGVLLDLERTAFSEGRPYDPGVAHAFTVDDLEAARRAAGVEFRKGDVVVLRSGFLSWYQTLGPAERAKIADRNNLTACGVEHTEAMARYLWDTQAVAVVSDSPALEVWPFDYDANAFPFGSLHRILLGLYGMGIGELWNLDDLARACAADGNHKFLLTSAPLRTSRGAGSPANALAIR